MSVEAAIDSHRAGAVEEACDPLPRAEDGGGARRQPASIRSGFPRFLASRRGSSTIEFVVVFGGFIAVIFFVLETTLYLFFTASLEKAAQAGVRAAVVSGPVAGGVPTEIARTATGIFGRKCSDPTMPCMCIDGSDPPCFGKRISCTGGGCLAPGFTRLLNHMRGFNAAIEADNVTVTYEDVALGFAGGPAAPMVTVTVSGVPFRTAIVGLLLCIGEGGGCADAGVLANLPARSASMTGEDLAL
jgi:hypothetical protein